MKQIPRKKKWNILWITILICFLLMGSPIVILLDRCDLTFHQIPVLYLFIFLMWIVLCILTLIGFRIRWGEESDEKDQRDESAPPPPES